MRRNWPASTMRCNVLSITSRLPRWAKSDGTQTWLEPAASINASMLDLISDMSFPCPIFVYLFRTPGKAQMSENCSCISDIEKANESVNRHFHKENDPLFA